MCIRDSTQYWDWTFPRAGDAPAFTSFDDAVHELRDLLDDCLLYTSRCV